MKLITPEISWHGKEPLFSIDFSLYSKSTRLATCGADFNIRIWSISTDDNGDSKVDFRANLSRHTKAVNVVRFSPQGNVLASGGDDCFVIIWRLSDSSETNNGFSHLGGLNSEDVESKETWQVQKMLRGHIEDVYDLAWSPNGSQLISGSVDNSVIIWDITKGDKLKLLKDHRQYVQGVCWDPCGAYIASYSSDRTCRIYTTSNYRCCYNINKMTLPTSSKSDNTSPSTKQIKLFHDETMPSFFRRLTFSPDGSLLLVPGGRYEVKEKAIHTTFVFTKASMNKPVMYFPATKKPTIAVRCCPVLFQHRVTMTENQNTEEGNKEKTTSTFNLPYRMIIAVASLDSVVFYDTQQTSPFAFLSNMHYASLTDLTWSSDGKMLAVSSRDGYCSLVTFDNGELGVPYSETAQEVIEKASLTVKDTSPRRRKTKLQEVHTTKDVVKEKEQIISPKMESLSIKKFVTVTNVKPSPTPAVVTPVQNPPSTTTTTTTAPAPRRISFVTLKPATPTPPNSDLNQANIKPCVNGPSLNDKNCFESEKLTTQAAPRRVGFVTLQPSGNPGLARKEKPPVPLEPDVIIIKD